MAIFRSASARGRADAVRPRRVLEAVCDTKTPQGACAALEPPEPMDPARPPRRIVALAALQEPGNLGTIWRTADAAGFEGLIAGPGCADPLSPKVQRSAMGSGFRVPILKADDLAATLRDLAGRGYAIVATALDGAPFSSARRSPNASRWSSAARRTASVPRSFNVRRSRSNFRCAAAHNR